jgi:hypothetical protein
MNQSQTPPEMDNEDILVSVEGTHSTVEELRTYFLNRRNTDDEFARDYRKGEFYEWLSAEGYTAL